MSDESKGTKAPNTFPENAKLLGKMIREKNPAWETTYSGSPGDEKSFRFTLIDRVHSARHTWLLPSAVIANEEVANVIISEFKTHIRWNERQTFNVELSQIDIPEKVNAARRIEDDIETIRQEMDIMKSLVAKVQSGTPSLTENQMKEALTAVEERVSTRFESLTQASRTLSAPIEMPPMEELTVRMVTVGTIDRLSEAMQEESKWGTWGGVFLGTLLGILSNLVTGGRIDASGGILIAVLVGIAVLCGYTSWDYGQRAKVLKGRLLRDESLGTGKKGVRVMQVENIEGGALETRD